MVGIIIGSGIFQSPPEIAKLLANPWIVLAAWTVGGVLSLFGAFTFAELATMYPQAGGLYVFIREGFGRGAAFVMGWMYFLISKPAAAAGITSLFGTTFVTLTHWSINGDEALTGKIVTTIVMIVLTWVNIRGLALSGRISMLFSGFKIAVLVLVIAMGLPAFFSSHGAMPEGSTDTPIWQAIAPVMMAVLWTYDGWADVGPIAGEVRNPQRKLPAIYLVGTAVIVVIYISINAVYMNMVPLNEMKATPSLAPVVTERLLAGTSFAGYASVVVAAVVLISTIGSELGSMATGSRVTYAQAKDGLFIDSLARVHPKYGTPAVSLMTQLIFAIAAVWFLPGFAAMANTFVFTVWIFYGMAAITLFKLRFTQPARERPYRCWGYPVVPALFILAAAAMTVLSVKDDPLSLLWLVVMAAGFPVYLVWKRFYPEPSAVREASE